MLLLFQVGHSLIAKNLNVFSMPFKIRFSSVTWNSFLSVFQLQRMTLFITGRFIFTFFFFIKDKLVLNYYNSKGMLAVTYLKMPIRHSFPRV